jgi:hypothetical protein
MITIPERRNSMSQATRALSWVWWPFLAIWRLLSTIVELTGRFVAMVLGLVLMLVGALVSLTIVGAIVGIPLGVVGLMLFIRGLV